MLSLLGFITHLVALVFTCIVSYHLILVAAPGYMGLWIISVVLLLVGWFLQILGAFAGE